MTESKYFLDTNIFLRVIAKDNAAQLKDCEKLLQQVMNGEITAITSSLVIAEIVWTCLSYYKLTKTQVVEIVQGLTSIKYLKIEQYFDMQQALEYYKQYAMKFVDACLATHHCFNDENTIMVSYDREFDQLPIKRLEPKQLLHNF